MSPRMATENNQHNYESSNWDLISYSNIFSDFCRELVDCPENENYGFLESFFKRFSRVKKFFKIGFLFKSFRVIHLNFKLN